MTPGEEWSALTASAIAAAEEATRHATSLDATADRALSLAQTAVEESARYAAIVVVQAGLLREVHASGRLMPGSDLARRVAVVAGEI